MRKIDKAIQQKLAELGFYSGAIDGLQGDITTKAIERYQKSVGLRVDGIAGSHTIRTLLGKPTTAPVAPGLLSKESEAALEHAHPLLVQLVREASKLVSIEVLESRRGRREQEAAFKRKASKAHFGDSAHNYDPAIALDIVPEPLDWTNLPAFKRVHMVIGQYNPDTGNGFGLARDKKIPIRSGADWNMDGSTSDGWDWPHIELYPWRRWAAQYSKLYKG